MGSIDSPETSREVADFLPCRNATRFHWECLLLGKVEFSLMIMVDTPLFDPIDFEGIEHCMVMAKKQAGVDPWQSENRGISVWSRFRECSLDPM